MFVSPRFRLVLIRFLSLVGILGLSLFFFSISIDAQVGEAAHPPKKDVYSVWAISSEDVTERMKKLMVGLRWEFGGPEFEPHVTVVGAITLTEDEARDKLKKACEGLKSYNATEVMETVVHTTGIISATNPQLVSPTSIFNSTSFTHSAIIFSYYFITMSFKYKAMFTVITYKQVDFSKYCLINNHESTML
ncbi:hypothetical protein LXL04_027448 [Taraxacum kok-saghyz]